MANYYDTELFKLIKEKLDTLLLEGKDKCYRKLISLPIKKIDGVIIDAFHIEVYLNYVQLEICGYFDNSYGVVLWKHRTNFKENNDDDYANVCEKINEFVGKIMNDVPLLKLGITGYLHSPNEMGKVNQHKEIAFCFKCDNVELNYDECSVCYEQTETKTSCSHFLCRRCWSNINNVSEDDDEKIILCPICRKNIYNI